MKYEKNIKTNKQILKKLIPKFSVFTNYVSMVKLFDYMTANMLSTRKAN